MTDLLPPSDSDLIDRTRRLITYLRFVKRNSQSSVRDSLKDTTPIWLHDLLALRGAPTVGTFLTLGRPTPVAHPAPPSILDGWLDPGSILDDPWSTPPTLVKQASDTTAPDEPTIPDEIVEARQQWLLRWEDWAEQQRESPNSDDAFVSVWRLVERARKEDLELAVGVGLVSSSVNGRWSLRQHVLAGEVHA